MSDVFISYSRADRFFAELLALKLEANNIAVWRDQDQIRGGDDWREEIDAAIRDCKLILIVLSKSSANSGYVTYEWARAFGHGKPSLQILIEECERHPRLQGPQYEDFTEKHLPWDTLVQNINDTIVEAEAPQDETDITAATAPPPPPPIGTLAEIAATVPETEAEPETATPQPGDKVPPEFKKAAKEILGYLNSRGFQMVSNERIRDKIHPDYNDAFLEMVRISHPTTFRQAYLRDKSTGGTKRGLKKI